MIAVFDCGFESGTFGDWSSEMDSGKDLSITSITSRSGNRSAKFIYNDEVPEYLVKTLDEICEGSVSFWIKFTQPAAWNTDISTLLQLFNRDGVELIYGGFKYAEGGIQFYSRMRVYAGWDEIRWTPLAADDRWHRIEVRFHLHASEGYHQVWIDNTLVHTSTGLATDVFKGKYVGRLQVGTSTALRAGVNGTYYIDDVIVYERLTSKHSMGGVDAPSLDMPPEAPEPPALLAYSGYETGDFSEWQGKVDPENDLVVSALVSHGGSKSAMFIYDDLTPEYLVLSLNNLQAGKITVWFKFDLTGQWNTISTPVLKLYTANNIELYSGEFKMENGMILFYSRLRLFGGWDESAWHVLAADSQWHRLEVQYNIHQTEGYHRVKIDGVQAHEAAGLYSDVFNGVFAGILHVGNSLSLRAGTQATYFVDDVAIERPE